MPSVLLHVNIQAVFLSKCCVTEFTLVRFFTSMNSLVNPQIPLCCEPLTTLGTRERPLSRMGVIVPLQAPFAVKELWTKLTAVLLFTDMYALFVICQLHFGQKKPYHRHHRQKAEGEIRCGSKYVL